MRTAIIAVTTVFFLTNCGTTADPKDVDEIATILRSNDSPLGMPVDAEHAECLSRIYLESGLSDEALDRLKDGQPLAPVTEDDTKAINKIAKKVTECE